MSQWISAFEEFAEKLLKDAKAPGVAIGMMQDGEWVYERSFGFRDEERRCRCRWTPFSGSRL